jgi:hypothetical protein
VHRLGRLPFVQQAARIDQLLEIGYCGAFWTTSLIGCDAK